MIRAHRNGVEGEEIDLFTLELGEQTVSLSQPIVDHDIEILDGTNTSAHDSTSGAAGEWLNVWVSYAMLRRSESIANRKSTFVSNGPRNRRDRKSTRLNSSHANISYAVFCLKKK